jgi:hypothetical protein
VAAAGFPAMTATVHPRLAARRARTRRIRQTVVALTVALFIATWAVIFGTLASGNDPALSASRATVDSPRTADAGGSGSSGSSSPSAAAPSVSTHQS